MILSLSWSGIPSGFLLLPEAHFLSQSMHMRRIRLLHENLHFALCSVDRAHGIALSLVFFETHDCCHILHLSKVHSLVIPLSSDSTARSYLGSFSRLDVQIPPGPLISKRIFREAEKKGRVAVRDIQSTALSSSLRACCGSFLA